MAIFLLIYVLFLLFWLFWAGVLTYLTVKYHFPGPRGVMGLGIFWIASAFILLVSFMYIMKADWVTVPDFFNNLSLGK